MKFASVRAVADDLKYHTVPEGEQFRYFLATTMLSVLYASASSFASSPVLSEATVIYTVFNIGVIFLGMTAAFRVNASGDNKHFLIRYVCLGLPVLVRTILLRGLLLIVFQVAFAASLQSKTDLHTLQVMVVVDNMLEVAISIYFYVLMMKYLKYVSSGAPNQAL